MQKVSNNEIYLTKGDTGEIEIVLMQDGEEYDFSNDEVVFSLKKCVHGIPPIFQKTFNNGKINFVPSDTDNLPYGTYLYDVVLHKGNEVITVIPPTNFVVGEEVHLT